MDVNGLVVLALLVALVSCKSLERPLALNPNLRAQIESLLTTDPDLNALLLSALTAKDHSLDEDLRRVLGSNPLSASFLEDWLEQRMEPGSKKSADSMAKQWYLGRK
ncbi:hypothetical protein BV898_10082 [Hypsibius exemplaris]|uniref:Uncharacterized protein n=1 Tax=Hypsibius exemplaris TaxID=2072580 RepID=A0A1W0WKT6_HYPEX|nr:hypothetical protein BV898_10082 [Hypsibius exemplaris]